jgi:hypothetical protein
MPIFNSYINWYRKTLSNLLMNKTLRLSFYNCLLNSRCREISKKKQTRCMTCNSSVNNLALLSLNLKVLSNKSKSRGQALLRLLRLELQWIVTTPLSSSNKDLRDLEKPVLALDLKLQALWDNQLFANPHLSKRSLLHNPAKRGLFLRKQRRGNSLNLTVKLITTNSQTLNCFLKKWWTNSMKSNFRVYLSSSKPKWWDASNLNYLDLGQTRGLPNITLVMRKCNLVVEALRN